jgi:hypothetical protein
MGLGAQIIKNLEHPYNVRVKFYPLKDGTLRPYQIIIARNSMFSDKENCPAFAYCVDREKAVAFSQAAEAAAEAAAERQRGSADDPEAGDGAAAPRDVQAAIRNYKAAHRRLYDKIQSNPQLNLFVTLTLDDGVISRTEYSEIIKHLSRWLDNRVRRDGLQYILVPEYHKDGRSIHFHGLMNDNGLHLENSHHKHNGKTIYNISDYPYGFTTAKRVTNPKGGNYSDAISKYVHKYMTKALRQVGEDPELADRLKIGGRYYLSGGDLNAPRLLFTNFNYQNVDLPPLEVPGAGTQIKVVTADDGLTFSSLLNAILGGVDGSQ